MHVKLVKPADAPLWGLLGAAVAMAAIAIGCQAAGIRLCLFKRLTGIPCPTCGGTRAALHLLRGDPSAADGASVSSLPCQSRGPRRSGGAPAVFVACCLAGQSPPSPASASTNSPAAAPAGKRLARLK